MGSPSRWYQHLPPATALIPCEGEQHRLTWRWGKVKLEDHDLGSERAMLQLGGEAAACLRALNLWESQFVMPAEHFLQMQRWLGADAALAPQEFDAPRHAAVALTWERAWKRGLYLDKHGPLLERLLKERAVPALRAHLAAEKQRFGARSIRTVEVRHVPAGKQVGVRGRMDSVSVSVNAILSSEWVVRVWAAGLAAVPGAFVVDVVGAGPRPGTLTVQAVRWKQVQPGVEEALTSRAVAVGSEDGWRLEPTGEPTGDN